MILDGGENDDDDPVRRAESNNEVDNNGFTLHQHRELPTVNRC